MNNKNNNPYGGRYPIVDSDAENELMSLPPKERLHKFKELLTTADKGIVDDDKNDPSNGNEPYWFQCDTHRLQILLALTLNSLGLPSKATKKWETCVAFVEEKLPPGTLLS